MKPYMLLAGLFGALCCICYAIAVFKNDATYLQREPGKIHLYGMIVMLFIASVLPALFYWLEEKGWM